MYRLVTLAAVLVTTSTAFSQLPKQPQTPAPTYSVAWKTKKGDLLLSYTMTIYQSETRERIVVKDGKEERVKYTVRRPVLLRKYHTKRIADLTITNAIGRKLSAEDVLDALEKPTIVLISSDGRPVDPYYLRIVKRDTLVIVDKSKKPKVPK